MTLKLIAPNLWPSATASLLMLSALAFSTACAGQALAGPATKAPAPVALNAQSATANNQTATANSQATSANNPNGVSPERLEMFTYYQKQLNAKVKRLAILPVIAGDGEEQALLALQQRTYDMLRYLGYYTVPPHISNKYLADNGVYEGVDAKDIPVDQLAKGLGVDGIVYLDFSRVGLLANVLTGPMFVVSGKVTIRTPGMPELPFYEQKVSYYKPLGESVLVQKTADKVIEAIFKTVAKAYEGQNKDRFQYYTSFRTDRDLRLNFFYTDGAGGIPWGPLAPFYKRDWQKHQAQL